MSDRECPALPDLLAESREAQVERHLSSCPRCRVLLAAATDPLAPLTIDASALPHPEPLRTSDPPSVEPGAIARFGVEGLELSLTALILDIAGPLMSVAPVSAEVRGATEWDLKLPPEILSYPAFAAMGEVREIRREQLLGTRASLVGDLWVWAQRLNRFHETGDPVPSDAPVGYPVLSDLDPRIRLARERAEADELFWSPAELLGASESFGASIRYRREALSVDVGELEDLIEAPGRFERLEADRLDLNSELPVPALAKLMRRLEIPLLDLVADQLRVAIESHVEALTASTRFARRRTGGRRAVSAAKPEERRSAADRYLANLATTIGEQ